MLNMSGMRLKGLRLRLEQLALEQLALDIEKLECDGGDFLSLPFQITCELTNIERDVTTEIKRLKEKEKKEYVRSPR